MKKLNLEKRFESKRYEKILNIACAGAICSGLAGLGVLSKSIIKKISNIGLIDLLLSCEQECEDEFMNGINEFVESGDFDTVVNPFIKTFKDNELYRNEDAMTLIKMFKKYFF